MSSQVVVVVVLLVGVTLLEAAPTNKRAKVRSIFKQLTIICENWLFFLLGKQWRHQWKPKAIREKEAAEAKAAAEAAAKSNATPLTEEAKPVEKSEGPKDGEDRCHVKINTAETQKPVAPSEEKSTKDSETTKAVTNEEKIAEKTEEKAEVKAEVDTEEKVEEKSVANESSPVVDNDKVSESAQDNTSKSATVTDDMLAERVESSAAITTEVETANESVKEEQIVTASVVVQEPETVAAVETPTEEVADEKKPEINWYGYLFCHLQ